MLIRIVKLTIREENISSFEQIFAERKEYIRNHKGCTLLELYKDKADPRVFFTYSRWDSDSDLQAYRDSEKMYGLKPGNSLMKNHRPGVFRKLNL